MIERGYVQLTVWCDPAEKLDTQWGRLDCALWLAAEKQRITSKGGTAVVWRNAIDGTLALWVLADAEAAA